MIDFIVVSARLLLKIFEWEGHQVKVILTDMDCWIFLNKKLKWSIRLKKSENIQTELGDSHKTLLIATKITYNFTYSIEKKKIGEIIGG